MTRPEEVFDEFIRRFGPEGHKGKHDLSGLEPGFEPLLVEIQGALIEALRSSDNRQVPQHVDHFPFHVDYIDSSESAALAFDDDGYSFIGITIPLIYAMSGACHLLSRSEVIASRIGVLLLDDEELEALRVVFFRIMLFFVVLHEWTHHVHGGQTGDPLEEQAQELDADGHAAYNVLANLIDGSARVLATRLLKLDAKPAGVQDEVLVACFVVAVGAVLFIRPPASVEAASIYRKKHPPQAGRMMFLVWYTKSWCKQHRPSLRALMTPDWAQELMNGVTEATWGMNGGTDWTSQTAFLLSADGLEYLRRVDGRRAAHVRSLSPGSS